MPPFGGQDDEVGNEVGSSRLVELSASDQPPQCGEHLGVEDRGDLEDRVLPGQQFEDAAKTAAMEKLFNEKLGTGRWRSTDEIQAWFGDWELLDPGLVPMPEWRPDEAAVGTGRRDATYYGFVGGVARKP